MKVILIVCTGNSCRSPMAEGLLRTQLLARPEIGVQSAGIAAETGAQAAPEAVAAVREWGADISRHRARQVDAGLMAQAALVVAMEQNQAEWLQRHYPEYGAKITTLGEIALEHKGLNIADPWGQAPAVYRRIAEQLRQLLQAAEKEILSRLSFNP